MQSAMETLLLENDLVQWIEDHRRQLFEELEATEASFRTNCLEFRNVGYPLFPRLAIVSSAFFEAARYLGETMLQVLEKVIRVFESDSETQEFFRLTPEARDLAAINPGYARRIRISRFDTLLDTASGTLKILENNTDCPAGVIFTGRVMQLMLQMPTLVRFIERHAVLREDPIRKADAFIETLLDVFQEFRGAHVYPASVCLLQPRGRVTNEVRAISRILTDRGLKSVVADPRDMVFTGGALYAGGMPVELIWNKINTVDFEKLDPAAAMESLLEACRKRVVCHVNSFQARYVTESKLCLAYLLDPRFHKHFTSDELAMVRQAIPWTRRLADCDVEYRGQKWEVRQLAIEQREQFVLKAAYDIRGDGVTIGRATDSQTWRQLIERCWDRAYVLQEYVEPPKLPVPERSDHSWAWKKFSLDLFMFNGRFQGFGSKIADGEKLNLFQGGSKLPVFSVREMYL
jgi:hypothetical protein